MNVISFDSQLSGSSIENEHTKEGCTGRALERLDQLPDRITTGDITDIVGVLADIKPVSSVPYSSDLLSTVDNLGLFVNIFCNRAKLVNMAVSKHPCLAQELADLYTSTVDSDDQIRQIGLLLGYPQTATDYFILRRSTLEKGHDQELPFIVPEALEGTIHYEFCHLNLSPEQWREEIDEYVLPLERAVRDLTPGTFRKIAARAKSRGLSRHVLQREGIQQYRLPTGVKIKYVETAA